MWRAAKPFCLSEFRREKLNRCPECDTIIPSTYRDTNCPVCGENMDEKE